MRSFVVATATAVVVALTGGCSSGGSGDSTDPPETDDQSSAATPDTDVPVVDSEACEEVRTGIAAFNDGDYAGTVEHFVAAVPLAEDQDDGSALAGDLVEAVRYYAELDAERYPEAARSSRQFAKYKAITLGQCSPVGTEPESPGTDV
ncbi:hypothetical protein [Nocardioides zhouii]|uniref:Lipoprotein n=1 Tax=Nocardioides zhouii TaxID=1168729 RepID=A0A4Q2T7A9_9ACTN|nr:hypothetical protein [Nocardioides zhouii]RYC14806.1 hypothetical protein EUA94_01410 [Nocardioides zhouii]